MYKQSIILYHLIYCMGMKVILSFTQDQEECAEPKLAGWTDGLVCSTAIYSTRGWLLYSRVCDSLPAYKPLSPLLSDSKGSRNNIMKIQMLTY